MSFAAAAAAAAGLQGRRGNSRPVPPKTSPKVVQLAASSKFADEQTTNNSKQLKLIHNK